MDITYANFLKENLSDTGVLVRDKLSALSEQELKGISNNLLNKIFELSVSKYNNTSYDSIAKTKGDITRLKELEYVESALSLVDGFRAQANINDFPELDDTMRALASLKREKEIFTTAYRRDNLMLIMLYENIAMAVCAYTSYIINSTMAYIRVPNEKGIRVSLENIASITKNETLLHKNIARFNKMIETGKLKKIASTLNDNAKKFGGAAVATGIVIGVGVLVSLIAAVIIIRELTYLFYSSRIKLADHLNLQASFVEMNVLQGKMRNNGALPEYLERQKKIHEILVKLSDKIDVDNRVASSRASKMVDGDKVGLDEIKEIGIMDSDIVF